MSYEVNSQVPPERSRTLRRAGVIAALAVGLVAGGFGIASAASTPSPHSHDPIAEPVHPDAAQRRLPARWGTRRHRSSGTTTANLTGGSDQF